MKDNKQEIATKIIVDLCYRIERMCRYSPLDDEEVVDQSMADRHTIEDLYSHYKNNNASPEQAARQARAEAIRLLLFETLS